MQRWFLSLWLVLLFPGYSKAQPIVYLTQVRIQPQGMQTRIIFELTQDTVGKIKFIPQPNRITIAFNHTRKHFNLRHVPLKDPLITAISEQQSNSDTVGFTFYMAKPVTYKTAYFHNKRIHTVTL